MTLGVYNFVLLRPILTKNSLEKVPFVMVHEKVIVHPNDKDVLSKN